MRQHNEREFDYNQPHLDLDKAKRVGNIVLITVTILLLGTMAYLCLTGYYSQKFFYLDGHTFKLHGEIQDGTRTYKRSYANEKIRITQEGEVRRVLLGGELYTVDKLPKSGILPSYRVTYPSGTVYTVEDPCAVLPGVRLAPIAF